ncbi:MAG: hypothetical protein ACREM6_12105 [Vulcanimicrobiaceae bacterium]
MGPLIGGLLNHNAGGSIEGASAQLLATEENDAVSTILTQQAMSARSTKMANVVTVADERTRETSMYDEYVLSVQGAEQKVIQKQMKLVDDASNGG